MSTRIGKSTPKELQERVKQLRSDSSRLPAEDLRVRAAALHQEVTEEVTGDQSTLDKAEAEDVKTNGWLLRHIPLTRWNSNSRATLDPLRAEVKAETAVESDIQDLSQDAIAGSLVGRASAVVKGMGTAAIQGTHHGRALDREREALARATILGGGTVETSSAIWERLHPRLRKHGLELEQANAVIYAAVMSGRDLDAEATYLGVTKGLHGLAPDKEIHQYAVAAIVAGKTVAEANQMATEVLGAKVLGTQQVVTPKASDEERLRLAAAALLSNTPSATAVATYNTVMKTTFKACEGKPHRNIQIALAAIASGTSADAAIKHWDTVMAPELKNAAGKVLPHNADVALASLRGGLIGEPALEVWRKLNDASAARAPHQVNNRADSVTLACLEAGLEAEKAAAIFGVGLRSGLVYWDQFDTLTAVMFSASNKAGAPGARWYQLLSTNHGKVPHVDPSNDDPTSGGWRKSAWD